MAIFPAPPSSPLDLESTGAFKSLSKGAGEWKTAETGERTLPGGSLFRDCNTAMWLAYIDNDKVPDFLYSDGTQLFFLP